MLDALYPLENKNGEYRINKLGNRSTWDIINYLPIYEMMMKIQNEDKQLIKNDQYLQNMWYYANTTSKVYEYFDMTG